MLPAEQQSWGVKAFVEPVMGSTASLHIRAENPDGEGLSQAAAEAFAVLHRADRVFSTWNPGSDLMRLRRYELAPERADPWIEEVRELTTAATRATQGLFTAELTGPDGSFGWDPTGIVKGWAVDHASAVLREVDGIAFCLNVGGDLVASVGTGALPADLPLTWRVGIADPYQRGSVTTMVEVRNQALATSGSGERGNHIVDPRTGGPAKSSLSSVTVTGPELTWADVWATACFVDPSVISHAPDGYRISASHPAAVQ